MLKYLHANTRPEISMIVHQTACFCNNPMLSHEKAITLSSRYLLDTQDKGIVYSRDKTKGLDYHVDADFVGGWSQATTDNAENVMSQTGYVLTYADCPKY